MNYSKSSHVGSCLSIVDILYVLYFEVLNIDPLQPQKIDRDIFILSKGHASAALYATLAHRGFFPLEWLDLYYIDNGKLPGHLDMTLVPGVECAAGSLGHGLSIGLGMALAAMKNDIKRKIFVLMGDGECNEGSVWEAIMLAGTLGINNLNVIIDYNHLQGMGSDVINQINLKNRLIAFGWDANEVDGHSIGELMNAFKLVESDKPRAYIANTIKGHGVSFMEDKLEWHYKSPNDEQLQLAIKEMEDK